MNIGTAIRTLRKQRGYSQKDLAERCVISTNTLCQIENNATFPQKTTINTICKELSIPVSYLLFFSINDEDIPEGKRKLFNTLSKTIQEVLLEDH
jgi:transcriptional regulator with XRE-family HTH domain